MGSTIKSDIFLSKLFDTLTRIKKYIHNWHLHRLQPLSCTKYFWTGAAFPFNQNKMSQKVAQFFLGIIDAQVGSSLVSSFWRETTKSALKTSDFLSSDCTTVKSVAARWGLNYCDGERRTVNAKRGCKFLSISIPLLNIVGVKAQVLLWWNVPSSLPWKAVAHLSISCFTALSVNQHKGALSNLNCYICR